MSCPYGQDDAAYVLGALSPAARLEFEQHLTACEDCTRAVRALAGVPGLLSRVDPDVLTVLAEDEPVPDTVLPGLARAARRVRRRRALATAAMAATAAAVVSPLVVSQVRPGDAASPPATTPPVAGATVLPMDPVGAVPVEAEVALEGVLWGTRLELVCTYDTGSVTYELPPAVDYVLVVRTDDGRAERVGSWRSVDGKTMRLTAATAAAAGEITSVEVRTPDGRVVLTST